MGNKSKTERREAHKVFEQKRIAKEQNNKPETFSISDIRIAATFALEADPAKAAAHAFMEPKVMQRIANGNFNPSINQQKSIIGAAQALGWTREVN
jgi:hypothetical protein